MRIDRQRVDAKISETVVQCAPASSAGALENAALSSGIDDVRISRINRQCMMNGIGQYAVLRYAPAFATVRGLVDSFVGDTGVGDVWPRGVNDGGICRINRQGEYINGAVLIL